MVILLDRFSQKAKLIAAHREQESVCMCVCVRVCMHVCVRFLDGEGNRVFASRAPVIVSINGSVSGWSH